MSRKTKHARRLKHPAGEQSAYYRKVAGMAQHDVVRETGIGFHRHGYAEMDRPEFRPKNMHALMGSYKKHIDQAIAAMEFLRSAR